MAALGLSCFGIGSCCGIPKCLLWHTDFSLVVAHSLSLGHGILIPHQGSHPCPLHWKVSLLPTGPPGKSPLLLVFQTQLCPFSSLCLCICCSSAWGMPFPTALVSFCFCNISPWTQSLKQLALYVLSYSSGLRHPGGSYWANIKAPSRLCSFWRLLRLHSTLLPFPGLKSTHLS